MVDALTSLVEPDNSNGSYVMEDGHRHNGQHIPIPGGKNNHIKF